MLYTVTPIQGPTDQAVIKPKEDTAVFLGHIGFLPLRYSRYINNEDHWETEIKGGILAPVQAGDIVIPQVPGYAPLTVEDAFVHGTHDRGGKVIALVHDAEYLRYPKSYDRKTWVEYLGSYDALLVNTPEEKRQVLASGVNLPIVVTGPWGYIQPIGSRQPHFSKTIHYAGNLVEWKGGFMANIPAGLDVKLYGSSDGNSDLGYSIADSVERMGSYSQEALALSLDNGFGLVWDENSSHHYNDYAMINMPHKLSLYLSLGLPVIAKKGSQVGNFVAANHVGIVVDDMEALVPVMAAMDEAHYNELLAAVKPMEALVRSGRHLQLAALKAIMAVNGISEY